MQRVKSRIAERTQREMEQEANMKSEFARKCKEEMKLRKSRLKAYRSVGDIIRPRRSTFIKKRGLTTLLCCSRNIDSEDELSPQSKKAQSRSRTDKKARYASHSKGDKSETDRSESGSSTSEEDTNRCNTKCSADKGKCIMGRKSPYIPSNHVPSRVSEEKSQSEDASSSTSASASSSEESAGESARSADEKAPRRACVLGATADQKTPEGPAPGKEKSFQNLLMQRAQSTPPQVAGMMNVLCKSAMSLLPTISTINAYQEGDNPSSNLLSTLRANYNSPFYRNWSEQNKTHKSLHSIEKRLSKFSLQNARNNQANKDLKRRSNSESDDDSTADSDVESDTDGTSSSESSDRERIVRRTTGKRTKHHRRKYARRSSSESSGGGRRGSSGSSDESRERSPSRRGREGGSRHRGRRGAVRSYSDERWRRRHRPRAAHLRSRRKRRRSGGARRTATRSRRKRSPRPSRKESSSRERSGRQKLRRRRRRRRRRRHPKGKYAKKAKKECSENKEILFGSPSSIKMHPFCGNGRDTYISSDGISRDTSESPRRKNQLLYDMRRRRRRSSQARSPPRFRANGRRDTRPEWDNRF